MKKSRGIIFIARKGFNPLKAGLLILVAAFLFSACGIEDFPFIEPVPQDNINPVMNSRATVRIPNSYDGSPFSHFEIFYRIYVSDVLQASTTSVTVFSAINSVLLSDYNVFNQYIGSTTQVNVNMDTVFRNRNYHRLQLQDSVIDSILSSSVWGTDLVFDFSSGRAPTMTAGGVIYTLWRSDGRGSFSPQPDRLFRNRPELSHSDNISSTINADVVNKADIASGIPRYTYAAMFITAVGIDVATYSYIYSTPALIHVFQLPD